MYEIEIEDKKSKTIEVILKWLEAIKTWMDRSDANMSALSTQLKMLDKKVKQITIIMSNHH